MYSYIKINIDFNINIDKLRNIYKAVFQINKFIHKFLILIYAKCILHLYTIQLNHIIDNIKI